MSAQPNYNADLFTARTLLHYLGTDQILTWADAAQREVALDVLPALLPQFSLNEIAIDQLCAAYMTCSYGATPKKHAIKKTINEIFTREMMDHEGIRRTLVDKFTPPRAKPLCLVITNHFGPTHAMYRCFGKSIRDLSKRFELVNLSLGLQHSESVKLFSRVINFQMMPAPDFLDNIALAAKVIRDVAPDVILYADIAMHPIGIFLSNLRLAPIQATIPGHPASSYSSEIDYFLCEENLKPYTADFSEKVVTYKDVDYTLVKPPIRPLATTLKNERPQILVPATVPKLNPAFLATCAEAQKETGAALHITTNCDRDAQGGAMWTRAQKAIGELCPDADVYAALPYSDLIGLIARCDMFLMPYPFAGTNLTVDCLSQGLIGVTMGGNEILSMTAQNIIGRCNLSPEVYTAFNRAEYVQKALEIARKKHFRAEMRAYLCDAHSQDKLALYAEASPGIAEALHNIMKGARNG